MSGSVPIHRGQLFFVAEIALGVDGIHLLVCSEVGIQGLFERCKCVFDIFDRRVDTVFEVE